MRDVKKVLEMRSQNYSQRQISVSLKISRDTIRKIFLLIYNRVVDKMKVVYPFYESVIIKKPKKVNV